MLKKWLILLALLPALFVEAQGIRLTKYDAPNAFYLNADCLYDFNMYERSILSLNTIWVSPNVNAAQPKKVFGQWSVPVHINYSFGTHELNYGIATQLRLPGQYDVRLILGLHKGMEQAASRQLSSPTILNPSDLTSLTASRYSGVKGGRFFTIFSPRRDMDISLGYRLTWEDYRFNNAGVLYPAIHPEQQAPIHRFSEFIARLNWSGGITFDLRGGTMHDTASHPYLRAIAQYERRPKDGGLGIFAQLGAATQGTPYSRMFDISGTAFAPYFFNNAFLTVRPNTFASHLYAHICLNYTTPMPLWELSWSKPKPFLQINALWGHLFGQDEQGRLEWDGLSLQSPYKGLLEPATGFSNILRWGLLDMGFAVAYQICPLSASYLNEDPTKNITFAIVANFILDQYK